MPSAVQASPYARRSLHGIPAHRVDTRKSLSLALRSSLCLGFHSRQVIGCVPVSLFHFWSETQSKRSRLRYRPTKRRWPPCTENQSNLGDAHSPPRLSRVTITKHNASQSVGTDVEVEARAHPGPVALNVTAYAAALPVIFPTQGADSEPPGGASHRALG